MAAVELIAEQYNKYDLEGKSSFDANYSSAYARSSNAFLSNLIYDATKIRLFLSLLVT